MASKKLLELMNKGVSRELQVAIQYMWQHVRATGVETAAVAGILRGIAVAEMKHAESIADRIDYLGGEVTTQPTPITVGKNIREMLRLDKKAEEEAITLYKETIKLADVEGDITTRELFEGILGDEEDHHNQFKTLLGE